MNTCKFYRIRDGTLEVIRVKVTQSCNTGNGGKRLPYPREARDFAARNGFIRRKKKGRRIHEAPQASR